MSRLWQHIEQPSASTEQHQDLVDLQLVQHTGRSQQNTQASLSVRRSMQSSNVLRGSIEVALA